MDPARQSAITACGRCGQPEEAHQGRASDADALSVLAALGGPCTHFVASDASVILARYLAITGNREPQRGPGKVGKRLPLHRECGHRHQPGSCPFAASAPGPDTARRGAAKAREALGLAQPEAS